MEAEDHLRWEAAWRWRAVALTAAGALLPLVGYALQAATFADVPPESTGQLLFIGQHAGDLTLIYALLALGALCIGGALYYLYRAIRARRPEVPAVALACAIGGPLLYAVAQLGTRVALGSAASDFAATGDQTYEQAREAFRSGGVQAFAAIGFAAQLAMGFAFVILALNAMRVGLLTRFMGVLGIIVGVLVVIPLGGSPLPVVQSFWLGALAFLFAGRWPNRLPPAWSTGRAEPWPSQQELRERREREQPGRPLGRRPLAESGVEGDPTAAAAGGTGQPHPASKKRKRKRRR